MDNAKAAGITISAEELQKAQEELADEELDGVAGEMACSTLGEAAERARSCENALQI